MRNPEAYLISSVLINKDWKTAAAHGINNSMFHIHNEEWEWLELYKQKYKKTPTRVAFHNRFPKFSILRCDDTAHFADEVKKHHARHELLALISETADKIADGDIDSAITIAGSNIVRIASNMGTYKDTDVFEDWLDIYKIVTNRVKLYNENGMAGIPTGIPSIDDRTGGMFPGSYITIAARLGHGKALTNSTGVLTPTGYVPMGKLKIGDNIIGSNGKKTKIISIHPQGKRTIYKVSFSDGTIINASSDHLWNVRCGSKPYKVQTTAQIMEQLLLGKQRLSIPTLSGPVIYSNKLNCEKFKYDSYKLGVLLGNGCFKGNQLTFSTPDKEIAEAFPEASKWSDQYTYGLTIRSKKAIESLGLYGLKSRDKFIPEQYLTGRVSERLALLQGLMDTDGAVNKKTGNAIFNTVSKHLRDGVKHLVESLGGVVSITCSPKCKLGNYDLFNVFISLPESMPPFRLKRKLSLWKPPTKYLPSRQIINITKTNKKEEMTCISVDAIDSLFVTEGCILTHNSWLLQFIAANAVVAGHKVLFDALEQTRGEVTMRIHSLLSGRIGKQVFSNISLMQGKDVNLPAYKAFLRQLSTTTKGKLHVCDASNGKLSTATVGAQIEKHQPDVAIIDYITLLANGGEWKDISKLSGEIKSLASNYNIPIVVAAQLNRAKGTSGEGPADPEAIAQSDSIGQDSDMVITIRQKSRSVLTGKIAKNRNGPGGFNFHIHMAPGQGVFKEITYNEAEALIEQDRNEDSIYSTAPKRRL